MKAALTTRAAFFVRAFSKKDFGASAESVTSAKHSPPTKIPRNFGSEGFSMAMHSSVFTPATFGTFLAATDTSGSLIRCGIPHSPHHIQSRTHSPSQNKQGYRYIRKHQALLSFSKADCASTERTVLKFFSL